MLAWVAWMSRWNQPNPEHGYVEGVFTSPTAAREAGEVHSIARGQKYECQVQPCYLDDKPKKLTVDNFRSEAVKARTRVFVATASRTVGDPNATPIMTVTHFVGVYSSEKIATVVAQDRYPGWSVITCAHIVED